MKQNLIYRASFKRTNKLKMHLLGLAWTSCSFPRLLLEVFLRRDFGERYFSSAASITIAVILACLPIMTPTPDFRDPAIAPGYLTWYLYIGVFLYFANIKRLEIKRNPKGIDFEKYTLCLGYPSPKIEALLAKFFRTVPTGKVYEAVIEPLIFLVPGVILAICGQYLGYLFIVCAISYSGSYLAAYEMTRQKLLDMIDEMICNEQTRDIIVEGKSAHYTKGVRFLMDKPKRGDVAEKLANMIVEDGDDAVDVN